MALKDNNILKKRPGIRLWAVAFWLIIWQAAAMLVGRDFLLASPVTVVLRFFALAGTFAFWKAALYSLLRIFGGFMLGMLAGAVLAGCSARFNRVRELIAPLWALLRAIPVASFVIVALIWVPSRNLSLLISFLIVFPLVYAGTLSEIARADRQLLEMAGVLGMKPWKKMLYIYALPAADSFAALCTSAMGLAWKSGIAAELISIPAGSIGEKLYNAKVYLMTGDLFAWTILIVLLSAACARLFAALLRKLARVLERM